MPQTSNVLSFVPIANPELGPRLSTADGSHRHASDVADDEAIILRRIAEAALSATSASGSALAMRRDGAVVCLARAGEMAPPLGARLDDSSGISGECLREGQALCCDDTETDPRVDAEACRSLGLRSVAIAAIRENNEIVGILEVFSPEPSAFMERHLEILRQLAELAVEGLETKTDDPVGQTTETSSLAAAAPASLESPTVVEAEAIAEKAHLEAVAAPVIASRSNGHALETATPLPSDVNIAAYMAAHERAQLQVHPKVPKIVLVGLALLVVASLAGWYAGRRWVPGSTTASVSPPAVVATNAVPTAPAAPDLAAGTKPAAGTFDATKLEEGKAASKNRDSSKTVNESVTKAASLDRITATNRKTTSPIHVPGDEPPADADPDATAPGIVLGSDGKSNAMVSSLLNAPATLPQRAPPISQGVEGGELERKVGATYPAQARAMGQEGTVVLEALVGEDGSVKEVKVVSGPPLLRQAAADAVRLWKYKPFRLNGHAIPAQTEVKLAFKLQ